MKCQACEHGPLELWDICPVCGWENDMLYGEGGSTKLPDIQDSYSDANGTTPRRWYAEFHAAGKRIEKWEHERGIPEDGWKGE